METTRYELADSFIKYITGVYVLQQDFIDDMRGGLQAILEKYNVTLVGSNADENNATHESMNENQATAKKTRKKNTKKEAAVIEEQTINDVVEEHVEHLEHLEHLEQDVAIPQHVEDIVNIPVEKKKRKPRAKKEEMKISEPVEPVEAVEPVEPVEPVAAVEEEANIPSHVSSALNTEEKKTRKPRAKKGEAGEEPKKKRPTTAYRAFLAEYSKNPDLKGLKIGERMQLASPIWDKIKEDPERLKEYEEKADVINKENGL
jgi:hypothetical protein